jgi:hypothetical protein
VHTNAAVHDPRTMESAPVVQQRPSAVDANTPASLRSAPAQSDDRSRMMKLKRSKRNHRDNAVRNRNARNGGLLMVGGFEANGAVQAGSGE